MHTLLIADIRVRWDGVVLHPAESVLAGSSSLDEGCPAPVKVPGPAKGKYFSIGACQRPYGHRPSWRVLL